MEEPLKTFESLVKKGESSMLHFGIPVQGNFRINHRDFTSRRHYHTVFKSLKASFITESRKEKGEN